MARKQLRILRDGEQFEVANKEIFRFYCCDCGLAHRVCIAKERNGKIGMALRRDLKATQRRRRVSAIRATIWQLASMLLPEKPSRATGRPLRTR